jgi:hypothetical protein
MTPLGEETSLYYREYCAVRALAALVSVLYWRQDQVYRHPIVSILLKMR